MWIWCLKLPVYATNLKPKIDKDAQSLETKERYRTAKKEEKICESQAHYINFEDNSSKPKAPNSIDSQVKSLKIKQFHSFKSHKHAQNIYTQ